MPDHPEGYYTQIVDEEDYDRYTGSPSGGPEPLEGT